jgi:hypothetical protein
MCFPPPCNNVRLNTSTFTQAEENFEKEIKPNYSNPTICEL